MQIRVSFSFFTDLFYLQDIGTWTEVRWATVEQHVCFVSCDGTWFVCTIRTDISHNNLTEVKVLHERCIMGTIAMLSHFVQTQDASTQEQQDLCIRIYSMYLVQERL